MIYTTLVILLMVLSAVSKITVIYFGLTGIMPMFDYMNNLIVAVFLLKASAILINFIIGEIRNEFRIKT